MITSAILSFFNSILNIFIGFLPSSPGISEELAEPMTQLFGGFYMIGYIVDFTVFGLCATAYFYFWALIAVWYLINWLLKKIPGVS